MIIYDALKNPGIGKRNWRWGEGTINLQGDFYYGDAYDCASYYMNPQELIRSFGVDNVRERILVDPDLLMDEGL